MGLNWRESGRSAFKRKHMLKGQSLVVMAIALILILVLLFMFLNVNVPLLDSNQIQKDIEVRSEMHIMGNALDAAKLYMETALAYSTYQACYDNLRKGGWDVIPTGKTYQGYALWDSVPAHPDNQELDEGLKKSIKSNMELYRKQPYRFLTDYYVNIPSYEVDVVMYQPYQLSVGAWNNSNFYIEKTQETGEHIRLEKYGFLQGEYTIDCYGIYQKGLEIHSQAKAAVDDILRQASLPAKVANLDDAKKRISETEDKIKAAILSLSATGKDYDIGVDVLSAKINYITLGVDPTGTSLQYSPDVMVKFEITNIRDDQQFPIYDGSSVIFSPMTLVFVGKYGA